MTIKRWIDETIGLKQAENSGAAETVDASMYYAGLAAKALDCAVWETPEGTAIGCHWFCCTVIQVVPRTSRYDCAKSTETPSSGGRFVTPLPHDCRKSPELNGVLDAQLLAPMLDRNALVLRKGIHCHS